MINNQNMRLRYETLQKKKIDDICTMDEKVAYPLAFWHLTYSGLFPVRAFCFRVAFLRGHFRLLIRSRLRRSSFFDLRSFHGFER